MPDDAEVVHELNNHFAIMRLNVELAMRSADEADRAVLLSNIVQALGRAQEVVLHFGVQPRDDDRASSTGNDAPVLVVEDDTTLRLLIRRVLEHAGHRVVEAARAADARAFASTNPVGLVVLDLDLPDASGRETVGDLGAHAPVLVVSGHDPTGAQSTQALGVPFLRKPFTIDELTRLVDDLYRTHPTPG